MKLLYRLGYYFVGLSMGLVIVSVIFSGKRTTCNYGPQARVLATLSAKSVRIAPALKQKHPELDSVRYMELLKNASVDFSKNTRGLDSCKMYTLTVGPNATPKLLTVENCSDYVLLVALN
jgi:hypothetical protein